MIRTEKLQVRLLSAFQENNLRRYEEQLIFRFNKMQIKIEVNLDNISSIRVYLLFP